MPPQKTPIDPDELELWTRYKQHQDDDSRNALMLRFQPLVCHQADKVAAKVPYAVTRDALVSAGQSGLIDAIAAFDIARGVKFTTYGVPRIRGAMLDWIREMDWVPRLVRFQRAKLAEAEEALNAKLNRPPTDKELARRLKLTVAKLQEWRRNNAPVASISLSRQRNNETDSFKEIYEIDSIADDTAASVTRSTQKRDLLKLVTKGLSKPERLLIILYYYEGCTMKQIGQTLGLSESRVSQMHSALLPRMKAALTGREEDFTAAID